MKKQIVFRLLATLTFCSLFLLTWTFFYCCPAYCQPEEEEPVQTRENPMTYKAQKQGASQQIRKSTKTPYVNDGEGPGGDKPSPVIQKIRPSTPSQTMRPSGPTQTMRPSGPAATMRPSTPNLTIPPDPFDGKRAMPSEPIEPLKKR